MRILQVYHIYPAIFGGVSRVVYDITRELHKKGHKVSVLTTDFYSTNIKAIEIENDDGVEIHRVPTILRTFARTNNITIPHPSLTYLIKNIIKGFDIIHLHGYRISQNIVIHHYARKHHVPYIVQAHGDLPRMAKRKLKWYYDMFFGYRLLKDASQIIALNQSEAQQYKCMGAPEERIAVIPNGIDLPDYSDLPPKGSFKRKFNIPEDKKIILYLGRIHKTKGIDLLVKAYSYLTKNMRYNDAVLVIAGPDDGFLAEAKLLSDSTLFVGFISSKDKLKALVDADVFVTPSFYGFPMTFLEACATGTPIITTTLGDTLEWIDGNVGCVTMPTQHDLAGAIHRIISDNNLHEKLARNSENIVKAEFSIEKVVGKLEQLYDEVSN